MSVKIIDFKQRKNAEGENFNALIVLGSPEVVVSKETGKTYVTARRASVPSTFDEMTCKSLIGSSLPGQIKRVETDEPYDYTLHETGETIQLSHFYEFSPEGTTEDVVFEGKVEEPILA